eukprot:3554399-Amphidinium_carterae.1
MPLDELLVLASSLHRCIEDAFWHRCRAIAMDQELADCVTIGDATGEWDGEMLQESLQERRVHQWEPCLGCELHQWEQAGVHCDPNRAMCIFGSA